MSVLDAVIRCGSIPSDSASREVKKRYSELLSKYLAIEVSEGLRAIGFTRTMPGKDGKSEKEFQGGLGPKKVDVSYSDEQHGLMLAVSIKSISFAPFGKNLKNRFADLCTESITLHLRFPYALVAALFAFPASADKDAGKGRPISTFRRAMHLMSTISGRREYTDPGEKFENATMLLFQPVVSGAATKPWIKLFDSMTGAEISESEYFGTLLTLFEARNPHFVLRDVT